MRNSKFLKGFCYFLIPILILILIVSVVFEFAKTSYYDEKEYFSSSDFLDNYMYTLNDAARNLIFRNERYNQVIDPQTNYKICYEDYANNTISDFYYLVLYRNIALTNIELTTNTNTIEGIRNYIESLEGQKANILNGEVSANSELISTKALQFFDDYKITYYTITENGETSAYVASKNLETDESVEIAESPIQEWHTSSIEDFMIYTTYKEELEPQSSILQLQNFVETVSPYENVMVFAIPICSILLLIMLIYLIISIGYTKNKETIDLNDFDKLPLEIIIILAITISTVLIVIFGNLPYEFSKSYNNLIISGIVTSYFIIYIVCMLTFVTIVKRIKAKTLISSSLCGKCLKLIVKIIKKFINKVKTISKDITKDWNITAKLTVGTIILIFVFILLIAIFSVLGVIIDIFIIGFILYKIIERINCYKEIEEHLKKLYEGKEVQNLMTVDFTPEFKNIVKYINDISNGFENAKQEGIKSERMKTELITNVSHDIKTPLTSIINYVDLLKKEEIENPKAQEYIEILDGKSQRLKKLTEDLVEASKASSGAVKLNIEKINIVELIKQTTGEFEDRFKDKKLEIISTMPKEDIYINADSRYMYRIIENLFSNISKYALNASRVYIDVKNDGLNVKISIKNISKEKLNISAEELIQRFVRGDKSRTTEGSGLGLSISQSLTELQNGVFTLKVDGDLFKVELEFNIVK